ncbi:ProQ/FINO family protein [Escherichia coli]|uniref:ProQ/FINO family protein n=1 Tax=Escherichia coli TaxID=562 RepID=UPI000BE14870|nr:ProQ/FinO family protein [Escherichia coli]
MKEIMASKTIPDSQKMRQMTRCQRKNRRRIIRLVELWPELFNLKAPVPLKAGIFDDLMQDIASRGMMFGAGALRAAVTAYTQRPCYYLALMAGGARYDLKGQPCGEVTPLEQRDAEKQLMVLNEKHKCQRRVEKTGA